MGTHGLTLPRVSAGLAALVLAALAGRLPDGGRPGERIALADDHDARHRRADFGDFDALTRQNTSALLDEGKNTFRFDTFGDEQFWGGQLHLEQPISNLTPAEALAVGLKIDADALPPGLAQQIKHGQVNLNDPSVTLDLLKRNAVVGVTGIFKHGHLASVGIQCALCHSTVNNSVTFGVGERLDGWANHDLDVGTIISLAPDLSPITNQLKVVDPTINDAAVRDVLTHWGPGKFDAELLLDGKNGPTLIPNAFAMGGVNLHTWTGGWGTTTYWNALVAVLEMGGVGTFFDERFDDPVKFPIAAALDKGHISVPPNQDRVTPRLPALHLYQIALPAPEARPGIDFDVAAAARGHGVFLNKAHCNDCHHEPLWTEPGWNEHTPEEMLIDDFQANRAPDRAYKTMTLSGLFIRENGLFMAPANRGRFYHDGRFARLINVVESYNARFLLGLTAAEESDLVEYLKSL